MAQLRKIRYLRNLLTAAFPRKLITLRVKVLHKVPKTYGRSNPTGKSFCTSKPLYVIRVFRKYSKLDIAFDEQ